MNCGYIVFLVFRVKGQEITLTHALGANLAQQWSKPVWANVLLDYDDICCKSQSYVVWHTSFVIYWFVSFADVACGSLDSCEACENVTFCQWMNCTGQSLLHVKFKAHMTTIN